MSLPINFLLFLSARLPHKRQAASRNAPSLRKEFLPSRKAAAMKIRLGRSNRALFIPAEKTTIKGLLYDRQLHLTHTMRKKESKPSGRVLLIPLFYEVTYRFARPEVEGFELSFSMINPVPYENPWIRR